VADEYEGLGLFNGKDSPTPEIAWSFYERGLLFNRQINQDDTIRSNRNFYIGKKACR
jgi:hypothetical protein